MKNYEKVSLNLGSCGWFFEWKKESDAIKRKILNGESLFGIEMHE